MNTKESGDYDSFWTGPIDDCQRYRIDLNGNGLAEYGQGGEGLVYRAVRSSNSDDVALKMLTSVPLSDYERVRQRGDAIAQVQHPNIMQQLETFVGPGLWTDHAPEAEDYDLLYTVARWVPGRALSDAVRTTDPDVSLRWICQIARAVQFLHDSRFRDAPDGIIHRDVKPSNVRIRPDGQAILIDFGTARPLSDSDLTEGAGTFLWRAPEVLGGPGTPGPASDSWGIGALAYWVLIGEPTRLEGADVARERLLHRCRELGMAEPEVLSAHIARLLESHPAQRSGNLNVWAEGLEAILIRAQSSVAPSTNASPPMNRNRTSWAGRDIGRKAHDEDPSFARQPVVKERRHRTNLAARWLLIACVVAVIAAVIVDVVVLRPTGQSSAVTYSFSPQQLSSGLRVDRVWTLSGPTHDELTSVLTMSNTGSSPLSQVYDEVIPSQVALTVGRLTFDGVAHEVVQVDPVVSYQLNDLAPGGEVHARYSTTLAPSTLKPLSRLKALGVLQVADEHAYLAKGSGQGPSIAAYATVHVTCRAKGYRAANGNSWWYQVESSPWDNSFWASAADFYNDKATAGSLDGTPYFDSSVPQCGDSTVASNSTTPWTYFETTGGFAHTFVDYLDAGGAVTAEVPTRLTVLPTNPMIQVGATLTLSARGILANGASVPISSLNGLRWLSRNPDVVRVLRGVILGVEVGVATVVAVDGPLTSSVQVTVKARSATHSPTTTSPVTTTSTTRPNGHPVVTTTTPSTTTTTQSTTTTTQATTTTAQATTTTTQATTTTTTATVASAPTNVSIAFTGGSGISASWDPPATLNGEMITGYDITNILGSSPCTGSSCPLRATDPGPPVSIGGLSAGSTYTFCVAANDKAGTGPYACHTYTMP